MATTQPLTWSSPTIRGSSPTPNTIDMTGLIASEAHGEFLSFPGYSAMVRDEPRFSSG